MVDELRARSGEAESRISDSQGMTNHNVIGESECTLSRVFHTLYFVASTTSQSDEYARRMLSHSPTDQVDFCAAIGLLVIKLTSAQIMKIGLRTRHKTRAFLT